MRKITRILSTFAAVLFFSVGQFALIGCNTTEGVGKDIEKTGDAIKDAARDAKD